MGVEGNLGGATIERNDLMGVPSRTFNRQSDSGFVFDGGLKFGYQHYFNKEALGVKQAFGLNVGLYVGAGNPVEQNFIGFQTLTNQQGQFQIETLKTSYVPIKTGIEINFLWDFLERGEHTLGLTTGIGYRFGYYLSTLNNNNFERKTNVGTRPLRTYSHKSSDLMTHSIYPQIGLHYYFGNHQFEFNYRYLANISATVEANLADALGGGGEQFGYETKILDRSYFSFGYSYRF